MLLSSPWSTCHGYVHCAVVAFKAVLIVVVDVVALAQLSWASTLPSLGSVQALTMGSSHRQREVCEAPK